MSKNHTVLLRNIDVDRISFPDEPEIEERELFSIIVYSIYYHSEKTKPLRVLIDTTRLRVSPDSHIENKWHGRIPIDESDVNKIKELENQVFDHYFPNGSQKERKSCVFTRYRDRFDPDSEILGYELACFSDIPQSSVDFMDRHRKIISLKFDLCELIRFIAFRCRFKVKIYSYESVYF